MAVVSISELEGSSGIQQWLPPDTFRENGRDVHTQGDGDGDIEMSSSEGSSDYSLVWPSELDDESSRDVSAHAGEGRESQSKPRRVSTVGASTHLHNHSHSPANGGQPHQNQSLLDDSLRATVEAIGPYDNPKSKPPPPPSSTSQRQRPPLDYANAVKGDNFGQPQQSSIMTGHFSPGYDPQVPGPPAPTPSYCDPKPAFSSASTSTSAQIQISQGSTTMKYSSSTTSYSSRYSSTSRYPTKFMCKVCDKKPRHSYHETCGLTCAAELDRRNRRHTTRPQPPMCPACHKNPCEVRSNGTVQPSCGYMCPGPPKSSTRASPGLCELCGERPKAIGRDGKAYPFCGNTCRYKAQERPDPKAPIPPPIGTCTSCIVCWQAPGQPRHNNDGPIFCGTRCLETLTSSGPTLIEIPKGHVHYHSLAAQFKASWDETNASGAAPRIQHVYGVIPPTGVVNRYTSFRAKMKEAGKIKISDRYKATRRKCDTGDSGIISLCTNPECELCNVVMNGVTTRGSTGWIHTFSNSNRADAMFSVKRRTKTKAMFMVEAVEVNPASMTMEAFNSMGRHDARKPFVKIVASSGYLSPPKDTGELVVGVEDAVIPRYLVIYS